MSLTLVQRKELETCLSALSDVETRALCVEALRRWHLVNPAQLHFQMHGDLGHGLVRLFVERGAAPAAGALEWHNAFILDTGVTNNAAWTGVVEFIDWLTRGGFAMALSWEANRYPLTFRLTRAGLRLLEGTEDHPVLPGYLERLKNRCPGLPPGVLDHLGDASECSEHGLLRAAVVMLGVGYEVAIDAMVESLVARETLPQGVLQQRAAARIQTLRGLADALPRRTPQEIGHRFAVLRACEFADQLRDRRNDASHTKPRYGFEDRQEVEELHLSAGRNLPVLWTLGN
jgi:hypothetical protein